MKTVILYSTPNCMACRAVARAFDKKGIVYDTINLEQHPDLIDQFKELGHMQAPIVTADGFNFSGYRPAKIEQLANLVFKNA